MRGKGHLLAAVAFYVVSRLILSTLVARIDTSPLSFYWQYADPELLRTDLLRTVFYLHSQGPLFNLTLGILLKVFPHSYGVVFTVGQWAMGLLLTISTFELQRHLRVQKTVALVLTSVFMISPSIISFENWFFYELGLAALMTATAWMFAWYVHSGKLVAAVLAVVLAACLAFTVGNFHCYWVLALVAALCLFRRRHWKRVLLATALPALLVVALYVKNRVVFGYFNLSPYHVAANLGLVSAMQIPQSLREDLVRQGKLSRLSLVGPFADRISDYEGIFPIAPTGVPVLDQPSKSNGSPNRHHLAFLRLAPVMTRDAMFAMREYPEFRVPILPRFAQWASARPDETWGTPQPRALDRYTKLYTLLVFGPYPGRPLLVAMLTLPLLYGAYLAQRGFRRKAGNAAAACTAFLVINIVGLNLPTIFLSWTEPNRYRFRTDALSLALLGLALAHVARAAQRRWAGASGPVVPETVAPEAVAPVPTLTEAAPSAVPQEATIPESLLTTEGLQIRCTSDAQALYLLLLDAPSSPTVSIPDLVLAPGSQIKLFGSKRPLRYEQAGRVLIVHLPSLDRPAPYVLRVTPKS